ncbi:MAG: dihydrodipicolinate synthase family protein [Candidatus Woesearchaeota archaeon]
MPQNSRASNEPITANELQGVIPALATLMDYEGNVDLERQGMLVDDLVEQEVDAILVMGTTGQAATFDYDEHIAQVVHTHHIIDGRVPMIVGAGTNDTNKAVELAQKIERAIGPTTFLEATGYYLKPPAEAAVRHYERIADAIEGNIVFYNVPGRTALNLEDAPVIYLANTRPDKFIGLKQAAPDDEYTQNIINETNPERFSVVSGEDDGVYKTMSMGGRGVISTTANACPRLFQNITEAMLAGNHEEGRMRQEEAMPFVSYAFGKPGNNPINLAYLFRSGARGCNDTLESMALRAENIAGVTGSEKYRERAEAFRNLMQEGDRLVQEYGPGTTGMDLQKYRRMA